MAIFKQFNGKGRYHDDSARTDLINYIFRMDKAISGYIGGIHVDLFCAAESMQQVASTLTKTTASVCGTLSFPLNRTNFAVWTSLTRSHTTFFPSSASVSSVYTPFMKIVPTPICILFSILSPSLMDRSFTAAEKITMTF